MTNGQTSTASGTQQEISDTEKERLRERLVEFIDQQERKTPLQKVYADVKEAFWKSAKEHFGEWVRPWFEPLIVQSKEAKNVRMAMARLYSDLKEAQQRIADLERRMMPPSRSQ